MEQDLSIFTTEELENMRKKCKKEMTKMVFNPKIVEMCAAIDEELERRGQQ